MISHPRCSHRSLVRVAFRKQWCVEGTIGGIPGASWGAAPGGAQGHTQHRDQEVEMSLVCMVCSLRGIRVCKCVLIHFCVPDGQ